METSDLYHQWLDYLVETEANRLFASRGRARLQQPEREDLLIGYSDPLSSLNNITHSLLPHLTISHVGYRDKTLYVFSGDKLLPFSQLSGGEREIVFFAGQIDRLRLTKGVLSIDEPELHLNPELIRNFVSQIQQTSTEVQLWLATHSYEAVEAAGTPNTFLLDRDEDQNIKSVSLADMPALVHLTSALGRAGFSLTNRTFVIVEGAKSSLREIPRYERIAGLDPGITFLKVGETKKDVLSLHGGMQELMGAAPGQLSIKGIVDSDFDTTKQGPSSGVPTLLELPLHEIENLYLHPRSLNAILGKLVAPGEHFDSEAFIRDSFHRRAGMWIWNRSQHFENEKWKSLGVIKSTNKLRQRVVELDWPSFQNLQQSILNEATTINPAVREAVEDSTEQFRRLGGNRELWKHCFGKETLTDIAARFSWNDKGEKLEQMLHMAWKEGQTSPPEELGLITTFLGITKKE